MNLLPLKNINLKTLTDNPWTSEISSEYHNFNISYIKMRLKNPIAEYQNICITENNQIIEQNCPYKVNIKITTKQNYDIKNLFNIINALNQLYKNEEITINVALGGTISVNIPNYKIILGRKNLFKRLSMAHKKIYDKNWPYPSGTLDMRYEDGFAFKRET